MKPLIWSFVVGVGLILGLRANSNAQAPKCGSAVGIEFQILPDNTVYHPNSAMYVKFIITNTGEKSIYLFRFVNQCSSQVGMYHLTVFEKKGGEVPVKFCFADLLLQNLDVVETFANPKFGIELRRGEVYGDVGEFNVPAKPGKYLLKAELIPPSLLDKQRLALIQSKMRVLECRVSAPPVSITVK